MLVTSQNITSSTRSSVVTRPYIAPAKARSTAANCPRPSLESRKYQRQYSSYHTAKDKEEQHEHNDQTHAFRANKVALALDTDLSQDLFPTSNRNLYIGILARELRRQNA